MFDSFPRLKLVFALQEQPSRSPRTSSLSPSSRSPLPGPATISLLSKTMERRTAPCGHGNPVHTGTYNLYHDLSRPRTFPPMHLETDRGLGSSEVRCCIALGPGRSLSLACPSDPLGWNLSPLRAWVSDVEHWIERRQTCRLWTQHHCRACLSTSPRLHVYASFKISVIPILHMSYIDVSR